MAKKKNNGKPSSLDDIALQKFFEQIDEVQRESRASDIGVVDDMYRYTGEEEAQQTAGEEAQNQVAAPAPEGEATGDGKPAGEPVPEGEATGDGKPAGKPVPEHPQGGPGGGDNAVQSKEHSASLRNKGCFSREFKIGKVCLFYQFFLPLFPNF